MDKRLYEKYKIKIDDKLKKDLIDVYCKVYGEKFRSKFEQNLSRVVVHARFTVEELEEFLKSSQDKTDDLSLEQQIIKEYEQEKLEVEEQVKKKKVELQFKLIEQIKEDLTVDERKKLDQELQSVELQGEFNTLDLKMQSMFNGVDLSLLLSIIEKYGLDETLGKDIDRKPFVKEYMDTIDNMEKDVRAKFNLKYSTYENLKEELSRCENR